MFESFDHDEALAQFFDEELITDVVQEVKSGKEGTVYCCRASPRLGAELVAAKVYRDREHRMFHNDAQYQEGRWIGDKRMRRAVAQKSRTGRAFLADTWVDQEFETLRLLSDAGASVPKPIARNGQALLISYIGEAFRPAPLLQHSKLERHEAEPMFKKLLDDIELWLSCGRVHADLSPFNILYWAGAATVIDFPQAIDPMTNGNARRLLTRDIGNVCRYFAAYGIRADPEWIAAGMWRRQQIDERLLFGEFRSDAAIFDQNGNHFP